MLQLSKNAQDHAHSLSTLTDNTLAFKPINTAIRLGTGATAILIITAQQSNPTILYQFFRAGGLSVFQHKTQRQKTHSRFLQLLVLPRDILRGLVRSEGARREGGKEREK